MFLLNFLNKLTIILQDTFSIEELGNPVVSKTGDFIHILKLKFTILFCRENSENIAYQDLGSLVEEGLSTLVYSMVLEHQESGGNQF